jgi:hypothetical protein
VRETQFNPEPVAERDGARQSQRGQNGDGPWRGEEQQVDQEDNGWDRMEADVCQM